MLDDEKLMDVLPVLRLEYMKAKAKHPHFPNDPARAVNDGEPRARVREEAAHVAVTAIRFLEEVSE